ncbi:probable choline kinase 2 isoform X2 [Chenopodium quinoa]|uniref:probable choline kinase 2 isoform X2 n=1 Tax=Chenopodium quinoa TaxID=63459 RepID=UPI000B76D96C|nr:probable choline kinase 2 isoform X2 [Chenopodium quinoa]
MGCSVNNISACGGIWLSFKSHQILVMGAVDSPKTNKENPLPSEATKILQSIASKWSDVADPNALQVIRLKGAMTNEVYQIKWPTKAGEMSRKVLVRIYGEGVDVFFNREDEIKTFECMSKHGQGPRLLGRFSTGRIEEFIRARTLSAADMRDPDISPLIAAKLREFHDLDMPGSKVIKLWDRLRNWLNTAKRLCSQEEVEAFRLNALEEEISELERKLTSNHCIGFCHNDLQYGNIMMDEQTKSITIIDYEYSSYNPIAFDIANHFCEMAADYHSETPHLLDYNKYPGLEERQRFIHIYLSSSGSQSNDCEAGQLLEDVEKYTLASHLWWGLWGIISQHVNEIEFDYLEYGRQRFQWFWQRKSELLGCS